MIAGLRFRTAYYLVKSCNRIVHFPMRVSRRRYPTERPRWLVNLRSRQWADSLDIDWSTGDRSE
jgi:hypothetical protein